MDISTNSACDAIFMGDSKEAYKLITSSNKYIRSTDIYGYTPLHLSVRSDNLLPLTCELIRKKADINAIDNMGRTPIFYAIKYGAIRTLIALMEQKRINVDITDKYNKMPMDLAIKYGDEIIIELIRRAMTIE